jgi:uncharacterized protein (AIM24 family)
MGVLVDYKNRSEIETVMRNLKSFRRGFEKSYGKGKDIMYVNYIGHGEFAKQYSKASAEERIKSYSLKKGNVLYVDTECLENCTEEEAYMMGLGSAIAEIMMEY